MLASERTRELRKGTGPERIFPSKNKEPVHALREVAAGYVIFDEKSKQKLKDALSPESFIDTAAQMAEAEAKAKAEAEAEAEAEA